MRRGGRCLRQGEVKFEGNYDAFYSWTEVNKEAYWEQQTLTYLSLKRRSRYLRLLEHVERIHCAS